MNHEHRCAQCGWVYECFEQKPEKTCPVSVAVRVNRQGPYCRLCRTLGEAAAAAANRGLGLAYTLTPVSAPGPQPMLRHECARSRSVGPLTIEGSARRRRGV